MPMTDQFSNISPYHCVKDGTGQKHISLATKRYEKESNVYIVTSRIQNEMQMVSLYKSHAILIFFLIIFECVFLIN